MMVKPNKDSAQVKIPPPTVVMACFAVGAVFTALVPSPFLPDLLRWMLGGVLFVGGLFLMISCAIRLKKESNIAPWEPTLLIIKDGPYRFSRNPIYISFLIMVLGYACLLNNAVSLLLVIPLFIFLSQYVVAREEAYLKGKFGQPYEDYCRSTRRWL